MELTWGGILGLVLSSGLVAAVTSSILQWVKERKFKADERKSNAELEAIFLIRELDALAVACANSIQDHNEIFSELFHMDSEAQGSYPGAKKPLFEIDRSAMSKIDKDIAAKVVWLENEMTLGGGLIKSAWQFDAVDWYEAHEQNANLIGYYGHRAVELAASLRARYGLDQHKYRWGMSGVEELLEASSASAVKFLTKKD